MKISFVSLFSQSHPSTFQHSSFWPLSHHRPHLLPLHFSSVSFVDNAVWITKPSLGGNMSSLLCSSLRWYIVGCRTILIDTHGNYSSGRQQTVVVQGQHKTINHNSWFRPPERSRSRSTKKQFCQHVFAHLSSSATGLFWAPATDFSLPMVIKHRPLLKVCYINLNN